MHKKNNIIDDYNKVADDIVNIYLNNLKYINSICIANKITPIYILQLSIYVTDISILTKMERSLLKLKYNDVDINKLYNLVYDKIRNADIVKLINFYDLSGSLNAKGLEEYIYDDCHLFNNGNEFIGR